MVLVSCLAKAYLSAFYLPILSAQLPRLERFNAKCTNVRDGLFLSTLALFFRKTHHPVQLALNPSRRGTTLC